jgi:four helix bundle protein
MNKEILQKNLIVKLSFEFGLDILNYAEILEQERKYVVAKQLLRSGTSIGANIWEAQNAESKADFIHKIKIGAKEAEETQFWLLLCQYAESYPDCKNLLNKLQSISKVLTRIISTTKKN